MVGKVGHGKPKICTHNQTNCKPKIFVEKYTYICKKTQAHTKNKINEIYSKFARKRSILFSIIVNERTEPIKKTKKKLTNNRIITG